MRHRMPFQRCLGLCKHTAAAQQHQIHSRMQPYHVPYTVPLWLPGITALQASVVASPPSPSCTRPGSSVLAKPLRLLQLAEQCSHQLQPLARRRASHLTQCRFQRRRLQVVDPPSKPAHQPTLHRPRQLPTADPGSTKERQYSSTETRQYSSTQRSSSHGYQGHPDVPQVGAQGV